MDLAMLTVLAVVFFMLLMFGQWEKSARQKKLKKAMEYAPPNIHGAAAWATEAMLKAAGLFKKRGLPLGYWRKGRRWKEFFFDGRTHLITFGGTGTGKTTQALIPAAMRWLFSAVFL
jgi:type IV secretory pathway TraG/TraD family ATPase VirD4